MKMGIIAAAAIGALATGAMADGIVSVNINPAAPFNASATNGGGFRLTHVSGYVGQMGGRGGTANSFITFCIELVEFVGNHQYRAVISDHASTRPPPPALNPKTAALYYEFRKGGDFGLAAASGGAWTTSLTDSLQRAIWHSEGLASSGYGSDANAQAMVAWAAQKVSDSPDFGSKVRVLQMTRVSNGEAGQDLLTIIPLPSAGGLAMAGLLAIGARRRRSV